MSYFPSRVRNFQIKFRIVISITKQKQHFIYSSSRGQKGLLFLTVLRFSPMKSLANTETIQFTLQLSLEKLTGWTYFCRETAKFKKKTKHYYRISGHNPFPHLSQQDATVPFHMNYSMCFRLAEVTRSSF